MRPFFRPLHLLLLAEAFAHHFVHRRLHKSGRNRLAVAIALTVIRDQMPVVHDVRAQLRQRLDQSRIPGICPLEGLDRDSLNANDKGMDKNFKRTFATTAWTTQSEGTVARWCVPRVSSVS